MRKFFRILLLLMIVFAIVAWWKWEIVSEYIDAAQTSMKIAEKEQTTDSFFIRGFRKIVEDGYYQEISYESCTLNSFENAGFKSQKQCQEAARCSAQGLANAIPSTDLRPLARAVKKEGGESTSSRYFADHPDVKSAFTQRMKECLIITQEIPVL